MANGNNNLQDLPDLHFDDLPELQFDDGLPELQFDEPEKERNPFASFARSAWNTLRFQLPSGFAGTGATGIGVTEDVAQTTAPTLSNLVNQKKEFALRGQREVEDIQRQLDRYQAALNAGQITKEEYEEYIIPFQERIDFIKGGKFDQYEAGDVEKLQNSLTEWAIEQQQQGAEYSQDLINTKGEVNDPIDAMNWVASALGSASAQIAPSILTLGASSVGQEVGSIYIESVHQIAEKNGITPEQVIERGLDDSSIAVASGTAAGLLDKLGANKVASSFTKGSLGEALRTRALNIFRTGKTESATEGVQTVIEQIGVDLASKDDIDLHRDEIIEAMAQGAVGGAGLASVGEGISLAREEVSRRTVGNLEGGLDEINESVRSGDSEVNLAAEEAFNEVKDGIEQTSDQLTQPEATQEEVLGVGEETEPGGRIPSEPIDITGTTGFTEPTVTAEVDVDYEPPTIINLTEQENVLTPELDAEVSESVSNYERIENLQSKPGKISNFIGNVFGKKAQESLGKGKDKFKNFVDDFSSSFENFVGEFTENNTTLRNQVTNDFLRPVYNVLRRKYNEETEAAKIIKKYQGKTDSFKLWAYAFLQEQDGASLNFKLNELRQSARNRGDQKIIDKTNEFIESYIGQEGNVLNQDEQNYYSEFREFLDAGQENRRLVAKEFFNRDLSLHDNYFPKIVEGFTQKNQLKRDIVGMDEFLSPGAVFEAIGAPGRIQSPPSGRFQIRKGIGDGYYITDFNKVFSRGIRDLATDIHLAPEVYKMKRILANEGFQQTVGLDNTSEITDRIKSFIGSVKGFNQPSGSIEGEIRKSISAIKSAYLSDPSQLAKQFVPGAVGIATFYWNKPKAVLSGLRMATKTLKDDSWIQEHAPNLYVRKQSLDNLVEATLSEKQKGGRKINWLLNMSDYAISSWLFFTEYASRGGTLENPNTQAANEAIIAQSRVQGTNALALAPKQFVNQKLWLQVIMPFTMMPLNISRQIFRNINPAKLGSRERRMMLAMGLSNIAIFQAVSEIVRELYDEVNDNLFEEDEEDELFDGVDELLSSEDMWKKIGIKSAMDAAIGWAPSVISDPINKSVFDPFREGILSEEDVDDPSLQIYYGYGSNQWDAFGVVGSFIDDATTAVDAVVKATEDGDEEAMIYAYTYLTEVSMTIAARQGSVLGKSYGPILRTLKEVKSAYKDEYKEAVQRVKEDRKRDKKRREVQIFR